MSKARRELRKAREARRRMRRVEGRAAMAAESPQRATEAQGVRWRGVALAVCAVAVLAAYGAFLAWAEKTAGSRMDKARAEGAAIADREAEAVGGWSAWTHRSVNTRCRKHGEPDAFAGAGALDADGKAVD